MVVPELRGWRAARPRLERLARTARPPLARAARSVRPGLARLARTAGPRIARLAGPTGSRPARTRTWQYTAAAATAGLALAAGAVTAAGPWDSTGQRTAERDRAVALERPGGTDHGRASDTSATSRAPAGEPKPAPSAGAVLVGLDAAGATVKSASGAKPLRDVLDPLLGDAALGARHSAAVVDAATGRTLYEQDGGQAFTPASVTKIATAVAALSALGPDHRFTTRAALEPDTREVVLVGGGDPTLTARANAQGRASLRGLADATAAALAQRGLREVTLSYDTTLYAGSDLHPIGVNDNVARVTALTADEGRTDASTSGPAPRAADPAADAARAFGRFLAGHGVKVTDPGPSKATGRAQTLASVSSPPLSDVVERMLTNSDNDIAEALARQTAAATGQRADFAGGGRAIAAQLKKLGLPLAGAQFHDGSGLNRADRLTANLLTALLRTAADPARPGLRPVLTGLPVAGFTGTLADRYAADGAAGLVRAKTGTLTGVNTLAGTTVDRDGRLLVFAFLTDGTTDPQAAQSALDTTATTLSACGCA
ncbi:D-alanyl-D-alanine carboxypeptidase/D-alanyl-D-alanine-endopeptidase [Streptomyces sp. SID8381]|uniref:D-alanyl-D-alanine carboxypeptidase/D-alanyl-D-alanine endopeptidase n=1 Tax=unclassified Streptomyces TaxID=2593676 RepID=UPI0003A9EA1F|nr:D-alanyl-D-alanine carboxypeptidase/D-alanyl-D-alanine-endopeptidase [Streptomyces sp. Amel2xE9]MYX30040.1 D-alanyl-D-alanine carboxypeptidase/D-alanyl-D-alanine-endopeptidase [Streptomyces sp. SID8381]